MLLRGVGRTHGLNVLGLDAKLAIVWRMKDRQTGRHGS
jgi:hypothetical protein